MSELKTVQEILNLVVRTAGGGSLQRVASVQEALNMIYDPITHSLRASGAPLLADIFSATRAMDAASANDVDYPGVGFTPVAIIGVASVSNSQIMSIGFTDNYHGGRCLFYRASQFSRTPHFIHAYEASGVTQEADLAIVHADGFKLNWTMSGSPTSATLTLYFLVLGA